MTFQETIERWTVNDYFTPGIKAEVIWDMLLSPVITDIVRGGLGGKRSLCFVTKEYPIIQSNDDCRGNKVDYVLADESCAYLVELKTTQGTFHYEQAGVYLEYAGKDFLALERNLYRVLPGKKSEETSAFLQWDGSQLEEKLETAFWDFCEKRHLGDRRKMPEEAESSRQRYLAEVGANLQKYLAACRNPSSEKYYYTILQSLIMREHTDCGPLYNKKIKIVYITPEEITAEALKANRKHGMPQTRKIKEILIRELSKREARERNFLSVGLNKVFGEESDFLSNCTEYAESIAALWKNMRSGRIPVICGEEGKEHD